MALERLKKLLNESNNYLLSNKVHYGDYVRNRSQGTVYVVAVAPGTRAQLVNLDTGHTFGRVAHLELCWGKDPVVGLGELVPGTQVNDWEIISRYTD